MGTFLQSDPAAASTSLEDIYCIRSCNKFCLVIVVRERDINNIKIIITIIIILFTFAFYEQLKRLIATKRMQNDTWRGAPRSRLRCFITGQKAS